MLAVDGPVVDAAVVTPRPAVHAQTAAVQVGEGRRPVSDDVDDGGVALENDADDARRTI